MNPNATPCASQAECLRMAVDQLCGDPAPAPALIDRRLMLADMLDELAREQALSPLHSALSDTSRALAARLRTRAANAHQG